MRRVLLDHCVPRGVRQALTQCEVATAFQQGWSELKNGDLLRAAEAGGFDVLVTADKNIQHQQNLQNRRIAIVVLPTNGLPELMLLFPAIAEAVNRAAAGSYQAVAAT